VPTLFQVDAFTRKPFAGNPAAVCMLDRPADPAWMQKVAAEMNLAETAFVVAGSGATFDLRWFTPTVEVELCGHATLASAHALWESGRVAPGAPIGFATLSGVLTAEPDDDGIAIELPARPVTAWEAPAGLADALGAAPASVWHTSPGRAGGNLLVEFAGEGDVRALSPRFDRLGQFDFGVIATARGTGVYDFISRYFAAPFGIDEDPVTGSAHCSLAPYWAGRLAKTAFRAWQASPRGGELGVVLRGERVRLTGHAVTVLRGELVV
jgi:PhzF family phenazine biosynthesis protein